MEFHIGSWNVRSVGLEEERNLLNELKSYNIKITAIQETSWLGNGRRDTQTHTILHSGKAEGPRELGVAFIVDIDMKPNILNFEPVNERICSLRVKTKFHNISFINVLCPTDDTDIETKKAFYQQLHHVYDSSPGYDIKIVVGNMNAEIGKERQYIGTIGEHSLHNVTNENGTFVINFAASKNMIVSSTCFPHRDIHKATWVSPDTHTVSQVDHLLIDKKASSSVLDIRVRRGALCGSDHMLVQVKFRCRISQQSEKRHDKLSVTEQKDCEEGHSQNEEPENISENI